VSHSQVLNVAVSVPLSREFDYLPPRSGPAAVTGSRVLVPFGRRHQVGVVMGQAAGSDYPAAKMRHCSETLDQEALLSADDLWLIRFTSSYYHHPIGEVMAAALPALLRQGKSLYPLQTFVAISDAGATADAETLAKRAPRQAELLQLLADAGGNGVDEESLTEQMPRKAFSRRGLQVSLKRCQPSPSGWPLVRCKQGPISTPTSLEPLNKFVRQRVSRPGCSTV
jgi:primosomal protein N' (replication factor Y)